jgi:hypothetical protein
LLLPPAAGRRQLLLLLPGHRFPPLGHQLQDALVVLEPLSLGQVRMTLGEFPAQSGLIRLQAALPDELTDFPLDCLFDPRL